MLFFVFFVKETFLAPKAVFASGEKSFCIFCRFLV